MHGVSLARACLSVCKAARVVTLHYVVHHGLAYQSEDVVLCSICSYHIIESVVMVSVVDKQVQGGDATLLQGLVVANSGQLAVIQGPEPHKHLQHAALFASVHCTLTFAQNDSRNNGACSSSFTEQLTEELCRDDIVSNRVSGLIPRGGWGRLGSNVLLWQTVATQEHSMGHSARYSQKQQLHQ